MKEYGGYIELETFSGKEYHDGAIALNCGRSCMEYILRSRRIQKVNLPFFLCDSVREVCDKLGVLVKFYHIDESFLPDVETSLDEHEYLYLVNDYGQISNNKILELKEQYHNIIVDNVPAFFQEPVPDVDTIYSCRKYFGVADGAYLYTDAKYDFQLEPDYSYDRMHFLLGRYEKEASLFYEEYVRNNKFFTGKPMRSMSKLTHNLLRGIDYEKVKERRTSNFEYLHRCFQKINGLRLSIPEGGYMYPLLVSNGEEIRGQLQQEKIYIPTLWPDVLEKCSRDEWEYNLAANILPLPIDQRYDREDMEFIVQEVMKYIN